MKHLLRIGVLWAATLLGFYLNPAHAQTTFNKYGPVNGVQMNTGSTYQNFAAGITDIQSLLSASPGVVLGGASGGAKGVGSINATALYINGAAVGTSSGAVSSVGLSAPTCFGVTGSPVTAAGTLGLTMSGTTSNFLRADGTCGNTLNAPGSGNTLSLGAVDNASTVIINDASPSGGYSGLTLENGGTPRGQFGLGAATQTGAALGDLSIVANTGTLNFGNGSTIFAKIGPAGNETINAPSSGNSLTVDVLDNAGITFSGPNSSRGFQLNFFDSTAAVFRGFIGIGISTVTGAAVTDFAIAPGAGGSVVMGTANGAAIGTRFGPSGNVTISAPTGGTSLLVNGVAGGTALEILGAGTGAGPILSLMENSVATGYTSLRWYNDQGSSARALEVDYSGSSYSGPLITGGPSGEQATIGTTGAFPLTFGTSNTARIVINSAGGVAINAPSSIVEAFTVQGFNNDNTMHLTGGATSGQSFGEIIDAGSTSADYAFYVRSQNTANSFFQIHGDGGIVVGSPTGGDKGGGTINAGAYYINGVAVAAGAVTKSCLIEISGTTPSLGSGFANLGCSSVSRNSQGYYTVAWTTAFTTVPICQTSVFNLSPSNPPAEPVASTSYSNNGLSTTQASVVVVNAAQTAYVDVSFVLTCFGT